MFLGVTATSKIVMMAFAGAIPFCQRERDAISRTKGAAKGIFIK
jgi:hypothetical protein